MKLNELAESYIEAILKIGNSKQVIDVCEPNVVEPFKLEKWMVVRVLYTWMLMNECMEVK